MKEYHWKTLVFYGILILLTLFAVLLVVSVNSRTKFTVGEMQLKVDVILDAGHGGMDGGAISPEGVCEAPITLAITKKVQAIFQFCGVQTLMTREDDQSLGFRPEASVRANKNADLKARLEIGKTYSCPFLSIHLNQFPQSKYFGAQVFYGASGQALAQSIQEKLRLLDPENQRVCKPAPDGVFLMKNLTSPAVTVECGFLSNPEECAKLQQDSYQTRLALAILGGWTEYQKLNS